MSTSRRTFLFVCTLFIFLTPFSINAQDQIPIKVREQTRRTATQHVPALSPLNIYKKQVCRDITGFRVVKVSASGRCPEGFHAAWVNHFFNFDLTSFEAASLKPYLESIVSDVGLVANTTPGNKPGYPVSISAVLPPGSGIPTIEYHDLSLDFILKGNLFADTVLATRKGLQPTPIFDLTRVDLLPSDDLTPPQLMTIYGAIDSVPGYLGQIYGKVPIPSIALPELEITWAVRDDDGDTLTEDTHYVVTGATGSQFDVLIRPTFVELTENYQPKSYNYTIVATVKACFTLESGERTCSDPRSTEIVAPVLGIPIPTFLAVFEHDDFDGNWLLLVPSNSPISNAEELEAALGVLKDAVTAVQTAAALAGLSAGLLPGITGVITDEILDNLPGTGDAVETNGIKFFNDYRLHEPTFTGHWLGMDADNEISSLIFLSYGRKVYLYNEKEYNQDDGDEPYFRISEASGSVAIAAVIRSTHNGENAPSSRPSSGLFEAHVKRYNGDDGDHDEDDFGDSLSSFKFD